jgi:hypothetical protein
MAKAAKVASETVNFVISELIYRFKFQKDPNANVEILQGKRFEDISYDEIIALFDALLKGLTDDKSR